MCHLYLSLNSPAPGDPGAFIVGMGIRSKTITCGENAKSQHDVKSETGRMCSDFASYNGICISIYIYILYIHILRYILWFVGVLWLWQLRLVPKHQTSKSMIIHADGWLEFWTKSIDPSKTDPRGNRRRLLAISRCVRVCFHKGSSRVHVVSKTKL